MVFDRIIQEVRHGAVAVALLVVLAAPSSALNSPFALGSSFAFGSSFFVLHPSFAQAGGTITGTVSTKAAGLRPLRATIDQRVCGNELPDEAIVTDGAGHLANAIVTLVGVKSRAGASSATIMNEKCRFSPRVQIVGPKATITTSSSDPILHTTNAQIGSKTIFNVALPVPGVKINKLVSGPGLVRVSCNTHPWMRGWVVATDEIAAVTRADGTFTLSDVPAGSYELRIWHEALKGASQKLTVASGQVATVNFVLQ